MLRSVKGLHGHEIHAVDGDIGYVKDFYIDDETWTIQYLVVDTGRWIPGKSVLISPEAFGKPDYEMKKFPVQLTKDQIKQCPCAEEHRPVAREHEFELNECYGWKIYWAQGPLILDPAKVEPELEEYEGEPHLRSISEVTGYHIHAKDGDIGHIEDFIFDDESWKIRYIEIDIHNLLPGKKVVFSPEWIEECNCHDKKVMMRVLAEDIKKSPGYHGLSSIDADYENRLFEHYGMKK